jgi:hypothetical protein
VIAYDTTVPRGLDVYVLVHFAAMLPLTVGLMAAGEGPMGVEVAVGVALVLWAMLDFGGIFEHRRWALFSELARLPVTAAALATRLPEAPWRLPAGAGLATAVVTSWLCLLAYRRAFDGPLPEEHERQEPRKTRNYTERRHEVGHLSP